MVAGTKSHYVIKFTDTTAESSVEYPTWAWFEGYFLQYSIDAGVDEKISANAKIRIDGPLHWTAKTS